jgi:hypothetical protein
MYRERITSIFLQFRVLAKLHCGNFVEHPVNFKLFKWDSKCGLKLETLQ